MPVARKFIVAGISELADVQLEEIEDIDAVIAALPGADGLITFDAPAPLAGRIVEALRAPGSTVRFMHIVSAGREGYDAASIPDHLAVTGADGAHSPTVAEHAVALMLALGRRISRMAEMTARGQWDRGAGDGLFSLEGRTLLVIGTGAAGCAIAARTRPFGMKIIGLSRKGEMKPGFDETRPLSTLDESLAEADVVAISIALAAETRHLLSAARLRLMKKGAVLVNIARGGIVDTDALADVLNEGLLAGAGLDVTDPEPLPDGHPLWSAPNVLITPHVAGFGSELSTRRMAQAAIDAVRRHLPTSSV